MTTVDKPLLAWHDSPGLKADAVARMKAHRAAGTFIHGSYLERDPELARGYRGCFNGCLTAEVLAAEQGVSVAELDLAHLAWWKEAERLFGIPAELAAELDTRFERLDMPEPADFAVTVTEAIQIGADLSSVLDVALVPCDCGRGLGLHTITTPESLIEALEAAPVPGATR
jgi:hypothetical protein